MPKITDPQENDFFTYWINNVETEIIQNDSFDNRTKIVKIGMKLDQLFLKYPSVEDKIKYVMLPGKSASNPWGPLCDFMHIVTEYNIPTFWSFATTPGDQTTCLIYDAILQASKGNSIIQKSLFWEGAPCTQTWHMANRIHRLHFDVSESEITYLLGLQLPNTDMTVHQFQLVAESYLIATSYSCRRLKDMFANYPASKFETRYNENYLKKLLNMARNIPDDSPIQYCIDWWSEQSIKITSSTNIIEKYNKIFWNRPFGSFYDTLIVLTSQRFALKSGAPQYYQ
uniref:Uncharacterized protein n=1 Tax=Panagrolaimus sp. ES5 TaxID=591445 RepID=A0AC34FHS7_9BILA